MTRTEFRSALLANLDRNCLGALQMAIYETNNGVTLRKETDGWGTGRRTVNQGIKDRKAARATSPGAWMLKSNDLDSLADWFMIRGYDA